MSLTFTLTDNDRFHCFKPDYQDRSIANALKDGRIIQKDADLINTFITERKITNNISLKRALKITSNLIACRRFIPPFNELNQQRLYRGIEKIHHADSNKNRPYSINSRIDLIRILKTFCLWLIDQGEIDIPEKKIRSIKIPAPKLTRQASDLLTGDEIQAMMEVCQTSRDRAMLMTLYEGGFRVGEVGEMRWGAIKFDGAGVIVNVTFKTNKPRYIRLVMAKEYLIKWQSDYPEPMGDDSLVFLNERKQSMTHGAVARQLERMAKRAGITKRVTPHLFRHTRVTHLIQQGVSESVIKLMTWGSLDSKMFMTYAHLTGADIDREIYRAYGIERGETKTESIALEPVICPFCKEVNSPGSSYCHLCGEALDPKSAITADMFKRFVNHNPELLINYLAKFEGDS